MCFFVVPLQNKVNLNKRRRKIIKLKNKYGFTLIELLAVIVALAIIALIATPTVMNTIKKQRKEQQNVQQIITLNKWKQHWQKLS